MISRVQWNVNTRLLNQTRVVDGCSWVWIHFWYRPICYTKHYIHRGTLGRYICLWIFHTKIHMVRIAKVLACPLEILKRVGWTEYQISAPHETLASYLQCVDFIMRWWWCQTQSRIHRYTINVIGWRPILFSIINMCMYHTLPHVHCAANQSFNRNLWLICWQLQNPVTSQKFRDVLDSFNNIGWLIFDIPDVGEKEIESKMQQSCSFTCPM